MLEWNALGMWEEGFAVFCEGLASNTSLTQLDLRNNQINHQGAAELCMALRRNSTLQELGECNTDSPSTRTVLLFSSQFFEADVM